MFDIKYFNLLLIIVFSINLNAQSLTSGKKFYTPLIYFYHENSLELEDGDKYYTVAQVNGNKLIKEKMGFCITEYDIYGIIHYGCAETFNTLKYFVTSPKGLMRKDILEYYHDMPLSEYEKAVGIKKSDKGNIQNYRNKYYRHLEQQRIKQHHDDFLEEMRQEYQERR